MRGNSHSGGGVVAELRPPRHAACVAAVDGILHHPHRARRLCRRDEGRREGCERVVLGQVAPPPRRDGLGALRLGLAAQARRVRDGERCAGGRGEHRVVPALVHPPKYFRRHLGAYEVMAPAPDLDVDGRHLRASALELGRERGLRRPVAGEGDEHACPGRCVLAHAAARAATGGPGVAWAAATVVAVAPAAAVGAVAAFVARASAGPSVACRVGGDPACAVATVSAAGSARAAAPVRPPTRLSGWRAHGRVAGARG
eukprot:6199341-Pleurochrysis_carterae.AAC.1